MHFMLLVCLALSQVSLGSCLILGPELKLHRSSVKRRIPEASKEQQRFLCLIYKVMEKKLVLSLQNVEANLDRT